AYSPDGKQLLTRSGKELLLFDAVKGRELRRLAHETTIQCMALSPDGRHAASGSGGYLYKDGKLVLDKANKPVYTDCRLKLWDVEKGDEVAAVKGISRPLYSTAFSADGKELLAGAYEPETPLLRRWEVKGAALAERPALKGPYNYLASVVPAPDGKALLTC